MSLEITTPEEFFREELKLAAEKNQYPLGKDLEFYIVNLLCHYISPEELNLSDGEYNPLNTPLAILLEKSLEASPEEKFKILKSIGDTSLYLSGFFQDYFHRKTFNIEYFISIGQSAYHEVSSLSRNLNKNHKHAFIFENLSADLYDIVQTLSSMSEAFGPYQDMDLLSTYERWMESKSERLLQRLKSHGIIPINGKTISKE